MIDRIERELFAVRVVEVKAMGGRVFAVRCPHCGRRGYHLTTWATRFARMRSPSIRHFADIDGPLFDLSLAWFYVLALELAAQAAREAR